jgi:hypothetical protein
MRLRMKQVRVVKHCSYPGEEALTQTIEVKGICTHVLAEKLGIREACYREEQSKPDAPPHYIPRQYEKYAQPMFKIEGADVELGSNAFRATLIHKFKVTQPRTSETDVTLELGCILHFDAEAPVWFWIKENNKNTFPLVISARQEDLKFGVAEEAEEEAEEEGPDTGCVSCNNGVEMGLAGLHLNGQKCTATEPEPAQPEGAPLASHAEAGVGTDQRKGRRATGEAVQ